MLAIGVPDWVPAAVVKVSDQLLAGSGLRSRLGLVGVDGDPSARQCDVLLSVDEGPLIHRLLTDDRMRGVWRKLRRTPCSNPPETRDRKWLDEPDACDMDICLAQVFADALFCTKIPNIDRAVERIDVLERDKADHTTA
jgi:hypothetical protein